VYCWTDEKGGEHWDSEDDSTFELHLYDDPGNDNSGDNDIDI
jgi:hypothetical protein